MMTTRNRLDIDRDDINVSKALLMIDNVIR